MRILYRIIGIAYLENSSIQIRVATKIPALEKSRESYFVAEFFSNLPIQTASGNGHRFRRNGGCL